MFSILVCSTSLYDICIWLKHVVIDQGYPHKFLDLLKDSSGLASVDSLPVLQKLNLLDKIAQI